MKTLVLIRIAFPVQKAVCLICLALLCGYPGFSQSGVHRNPMDSLPVSLENYKESLVLRTDRDLYVVGEEVWMKVYKLDAHGSKADNFSKVVYVELLNQTGYPVNQLKLYLPDRSGSTGFSLSDTLSSGNYLLRAYTSWMKNYPPEDFAFRTISVINPFRSMESIGAGSSESAGGEGNTGPGLPAPKPLSLDITFDSINYGTRERVKASIRARDASGHPVEADLSVSIVKSGLFKEQQVGLTELPDRGLHEEPAMSARYLPEAEGVVLSGNIYNSSTDRPIGNEDVILSIVGNAARCQIYKSNSRGGFYFNLFDSGVLEMVIQPVDAAVSNYYVELEPDFLNASEHPLPGPLELDTSRLRALNQAIINMQIENIYKPYRQDLASSHASAAAYDFYGEPEYRIQISDYISLNNLREVIKEIVPAVSVRIRDGQSVFWVDNGIADQQFSKGPLILVDGVPFDDVDQILNIGIGELESIEVIDLKYVLEGRLFEGIIHFITIEGKMAGLEFDHLVFRQAYAALSERSTFQSPEYSSDSLKGSPLADFRNTLYWKPDVHTRKDGSGSFEFYTSDEKGEYTVIVEGRSADGQSGVIYSKLMVQ
jgi:hypothetical protein